MRKRRRRVLTPEQKLAARLRWNRWYRNNRARWRAACARWEKKNPTWRRDWLRARRERLAWWKNRTLAHDTHEAMQHGLYPINSDRQSYRRICDGRVSWDEELTAEELIARWEKEHHDEERH